MRIVARQRTRWHFVALLLLAAPAVAAQIPPAEYAARRAALAERMGPGVLLALGAREPEHDYLPFAQRSPFRYLTGIVEPDAALVMVRQGDSVATTLFVQPRDPAREVWTGPRLGVEGAAARTGLPARPRDELRPYLDSLLRASSRLHVVGELRSDLRTADAQLIESITADLPGVTVVDLAPEADRLRGRKSAAELALIRKAVDITVEAHRNAMRLIEPGLNEFEVQALVEYIFRRSGAERPAFASIVGSGPYATSLHYNANDRFLQAGDVIVMDIGASYRGYAADVTRTVPVSGTFTPAQREIYQLVRDAQAAAERQAMVGAPARLMSDSAQAVIARGLARLGLIEAPDARFDAPPGTCGNARQAECPQWRLFYMHGLGHGIGLDVHDPEQYSLPPGRIAPGSAFTIEPGVYVRGNLLSLVPDTPRNRRLIERIRPAVQRYADIGVRIEDDYIVTDQGVEWISRAPREIAEIEALMAEPWTGPSPRRPEVVEWYRETAPVPARP